MFSFLFTQYTSDYGIESYGYLFSFIACIKKEEDREVSDYIYNRKSLYQVKSNIFV